MGSTSVSQLKATLSEQLRRVKSGESLIVTERGRPIARIVPIDPAEVDTERRLTALELDGIVRRPSQTLPPSFWAQSGPEDPTDSVRGAVLEEREGGW